MASRLPEDLLGNHDDVDDGIDITVEPVAQVASHLSPSHELWTTLFFTDLQGSTALWRKDAKAMERALAAHDYVLHHLVDHFRGIVFKTAGDAVLAVFADVTSALQCAITAEAFLRRLDGANRRCRLGARLRVVIHTGRVFVRNRDCFGPEVCYASRLVAVAPPRQILITEAALGALNPAALPRLRFEVHRVGDVRDFGPEGVVYRVGRGPPRGGEPAGGG